MVYLLFDVLFAVYKLENSVLALIYCQKLKYVMAQNL